VLRVILPGFFALALAATVSAAQVPSAASLSAEINAKGAKEVVSRLNNAQPGADGQNEWNRVTHEMWLGLAAYIELAPKLVPGTDAGTSEDLGICLAHALPLAPITVLRAIDPKDGPALGVSRVCSAPFIEDSVKDVPAYIRAAQQKVSAVTASELQPVKAACLKHLDTAAKHISSSPK
jgi:hypothetical protein